MWNNLKNAMMTLKDKSHKRDEKNAYVVEPQDGKTYMEAKPSILYKNSLIIIARECPYIDLKWDPYNSQS